MSWIEKPENDIVGGFNLTLLGIDEAYLNISASTNYTLWLYELSSNCFKCPFRIARQLSEPDDLRELVLQQKVSTRYPITYRLRTSGTPDLVPSYDGYVDSYKFCDIDYRFGEFGVFNIHASEVAGSRKCEVTVAAEPVNIYYPLLIAVIFYILLFSFVSAASFLWRKYRSTRSSSVDSSLINSGNSKENGSTKNEAGEKHSTASSNATGPSQQPQATPNPSQTSRVNPAPRQKQRLRSLDTFRGISIVVMIFVNNGGAHYYFNDHATWDGLYIADLVFPWFLWIMGVCIPIAVKSQVKRGTARFDIFWNITVRSLKLIALGVILNSRWGPVQFGENANLRIPGILQRFGICYFVCASLVLFSMTFNISKPETNKIKAMFQDIGILWLSWIIVLLILLAHCLITFYLPVDGCPTGYLGPAGLHNNGTVSKECIGGASGYLDIKIFKKHHIYQYPTAKTEYNSDVYDPEGFLGTLTSIVQVWIGVQAGATMLVFPRAKSRLIRWGIWAIVTGAIGTALCGGQETGFGIPVNKNLWSLSFVMVTTSFAFILLCVLYVIIDIKHYWSGTPFFEPGMNSILLYVGHFILSDALPWNWAIGLMRTHAIRLLESLWGTSLWVLVAMYLHMKKSYWSV